MSTDKFNQAYSIFVLKRKYGGTDDRRTGDWRQTDEDLTSEVKSQNHTTTAWWSIEMVIQLI